MARLTTIVLLAIIAVLGIVAVSATVGTGVPAIDNTVDDIADQSLDGTPTPAPTGATDNGGPTATGGSGTAPATTETPSDAETINLEELRLALHEQVNEHRGDSFGALTRRGDLHEAAQATAKNMAEKGYFGKYGPDNEYSPRQLYIDHQLGGCDPRMNIYKTSDVSAAAFEDEFAQRVVAEWAEDPDANNNLLDADMTAQGFGVDIGEYEGQRTVFIVQTFCDG